MANIPVGGEPGTVHGNTWPEWGIDQAGHIVEARNDAQKIAFMKAGYLQWFTSRKAAVNGYKGQQGFFGSGSLPNPLQAFLDRLAQGSTWIRVTEVFLGLLLIAVGVAKMTDAVPVATKVAAALK